MKTVQIKDWEHIIAVIEMSGQHKYDIRTSAIQFRGQSDTNWRLNSSLNRIVVGDAISEQKAIYYEKQVQAEYAAQCHLIEEKLAYNDSMHPLAMFIDMQHFSCPTRVLDWSSSPYVALYFAVNEHAHCDGAFYVWISAFYNKAMNKRYPQTGAIDVQDVTTFNQFPYVQLVFPTRKNERIVRQQGTFTISNNILKSYCEMIDEPLKWGAESGLYKYVIPSNVKLEFLARLKMMNISASSLFPGMDGLGRSIKETLLIRKWQQK